jgi:hypothetical protein
MRYAVLNSFAVTGRRVPDFRNTGLAGMPTDITADNLIRAAANGTRPFVALPADFSAAMDAITHPILSPY